MSTSVHEGKVPTPTLLTDLPPLKVNTFADVPVSTDPVQVAREARIRALIGSLVRITVTDGRIYEGTLYCVDDQANVMMSEYHRVQPPEDAEMQLRASALFAAMKDIVAVQVKATALAKADEKVAAEAAETNPEANPEASK
jgi:small nuclear ribonucleoprotein (snRNP)-like protein